MIQHKVTASNRVKIYVNGTQQTLMNQQTIHFHHKIMVMFLVMQANNSIGYYANFNNGYLDGYLSELNFIDGLTLDPMT